MSAEKEGYVRQATLADVENIFALINRNKDLLIPRSVGGIVDSIDRFFIAEAEGEMVGCASYQIHPELGDIHATTVEIVSLAVKTLFRGRGIGRKLVETVAKRVEQFSPKEILVLTFSPEFFCKLGFVEISKTKVMHKLYTGCINCTKHTDPFTCPEIAMVRRI